MQASGYYRRHRRWELRPSRSPASLLPPVGGFGEQPQPLSGWGSILARCPLIRPHGRTGRCLRGVGRHVKQGWAHGGARRRATSTRHRRRRPREDRSKVAKIICVFVTDLSKGTTHADTLQADLCNRQKANLKRLRSRHPYQAGMTPARRRLRTWNRSRSGASWGSVLALPRPTNPRSCRVHAHVHVHVARAPVPRATRWQAVASALGSSEARAAGDSEAACEVAASHRQRMQHKPSSLQRDRGRMRVRRGRGSPGRRRSWLWPSPPARAGWTDW